MIRLAPLLALGIFVGCTPAPPPTRSQVAARTACRAESEATYNRQNRDLLSARDTTDTPFSTSGFSGNTTAGLSREYAREQFLDNCLKGNNGGPPVTPQDGTAFQGPVVKQPSLPAH